MTGNVRIEGKAFALSITFTPSFFDYFMIPFLSGYLNSKNHLRICCCVESNVTPAPTIVDDDSFEKELCKAKEAGEWFRLQAGEGDNCRDVIQCTSSVRLTLDWFQQMISRCSHGWIFRVCKPSVAQLDSLSTSRSKRATGKNRSRIASSKRRFVN